MLLSKATLSYFAADHKSLFQSLFFWMLLSKFDPRILDGSPVFDVSILIFLDASL